MAELKRLTLKGWKSIKNQTIDFGRLNVLIGSNGSGKSNLISFFKMLNELIGERLQNYIGTWGGANSFLHYGRQVTRNIEADIEFTTPAGTNHYALDLSFAAVDRLLFADERTEFHRQGSPMPKSDSIGSGHPETMLKEAMNNGDLKAKVIHNLLRLSRVYQFHDTTLKASLRNPCLVEDNWHLMPDGANLPAMLYRFRQTNPRVCTRIENAISQIFPRFRSFVLEPRKLNERQIALNWNEQETDYLFEAHQFSDGTLRAIALVTLLLQPEDELPDVIFIDEPELGLHPFAIETLAELLRRAGEHCQVVVATQSPGLVSAFSPDEVITVDRRGRETIFQRHQEADLAHWLERYTLGELWQKNVLGGGPY